MRGPDGVNVKGVNNGTDVSSEMDVSSETDESSVDIEDNSDGIVINRRLRTC
jgi:hypothetical protein